MRVSMGQLHRVNGPSGRSRVVSQRSSRSKPFRCVASSTKPKDAAPVKQTGASLDDRILSGEFTDEGSTKEKLTRPIRKVLASEPTGVGRIVAMQLAKLGRQWRSEASKKMPEARGDIREIVGQPVFVPLFKLYLAYGGVFRLSFGPRSFVVVSDPQVVRQILLTNADKYSKGLLSEILDFVMGTGLIPADGEIWLKRRRAIVPALHKKYVASMVDMFGECSLHGGRTLEAAARLGEAVEMENFYSRLGLDIIGKAVFNYDFDSLTHDDPVIKAVYTALREAEYRSIALVPYWNIPLLNHIVPRQRKCLEALKIINDTLDTLVDKCKRLVEEEDDEFNEEFLSEQDPSILHFLLASGDAISSKQLRDDLMTLLIAGHETTAAVLTWTTHLLVQHPDVLARIREEVDRVLGDRKPTVADIRELRFLTRCINEGMRLYPQPPVLIRRALEPDSFNGFAVTPGSDIFISTWNLHRSPSLWERADEFDPDRFGPLDAPSPNEINLNWKYLPFGGGKRKCIGDQFALFEAVVALAMIIRRYDLALAPNRPPVGMTTGATIHTVNGLWMTVTPRPVPIPTHHDIAPLAASNGHVGTHAAGHAHAHMGEANGHASENGAAAGGCPFGHGKVNGTVNGHATVSGNGTVNGSLNGHHAAAATGNGHAMNGHATHANGSDNGNGAPVSEKSSEELTAAR